MEIRTVAAGRGWEWIVEGFRIFRKQPLTWIVLGLIVAIIGFGTVVPIIGMLVILLFPTLFAGVLLACDTTDQGEDPEFNQLFSAFKTHAGPLITIGGIFLTGNIITGSIMLGIAGNEALLVILGKSTGDIEAMRAAMRSLLQGIAVGLAAFLPVLMAIWFAPALIVFRNTPPIEAMKQSFTACWRNTLPLLVYGVATLVLGFIASIPLMLGLIVLLPVLVCSIYASYKDIFPAVAAAAEHTPQ
jgi:hypothetical protein